MAALQGAGNPAPAVFVGNLSYDVTEQNIIDYFGQAGPVKTVRIVSDRDTGRPRGFGFVEFYDIPTAESAIRNLSGKDFNGRVIRIVFAEGGPFESRAPPSGAARPGAMGGYGGGYGGAHAGGGAARAGSNTGRVVGGDLAYHSSLGAAQLLGLRPSPGAPADGLTKLLARRSRSELYDLLAQVQALARQDRAAARDMLASNPVLLKALFQSQIILGYVSNPRGDVAPKGCAPPGTMPGRGFPTAAPAPAPMPHEPAQVRDAAHSDSYAGYGQHPPQHAGYSSSNYYGGGANGSASSHEQPAAAVYAEPPVDPRQSRPASAPGSRAYAPGMTEPLTGAGAPGAGAAGAGMAGFGATAGMTPEQQQALLQQVLSLTPAQLEQLPAAQRGQVLALQQQMTQRA